AHYGWVVSLFEAGEVTQAKGHCERMLSEGIGEYYEILDIYLKVLFQLEEYDQVAELIEVVLQESQVPPERAEAFYRMFERCRHLTNDKDGKNDLTAFQKSLSDEELTAYKNFLRSEEKSNPYDKGVVLQFLKD